MTAAVLSRSLLGGAWHEMPCCTDASQEAGYQATFSSLVVARSPQQPGCTHLMLLAGVAARELLMSHAPPPVIYWTALSKCNVQLVSNIIIFCYRGKFCF